MPNMNRPNGSDSDDESKKEDEYLDWRMDPEESLSDWTIEVTLKRQPNASSEKDTTKAVFHVHKVMLAVGSRKSEYFVRLFQSNHFQEAASNKSCIELDELAFKAFPFMLDYQYKTKEPLNATTEMATAFSYLGQYFDMPRLQRDVAEFMRKDLQGDEVIDKCGIYYEHGSIFHDVKILKLVEDKCVECLDNVKQSSRIVIEAEPQFWVNVVQRYANMKIYGGLPVENFSRQLCWNVATICLESKGIDAEHFTTLTDTKLIPIVHPRAALSLLELETKFGVPVDNELSSLQARCVKALAEKWAELDFTKSKTLSILRMQSPALLIELLAKATERAKRGQSYY